MYEAVLIFSIHHFLCHISVVIVSITYFSKLIYKQNLYLIGDFYLLLLLLLSDLIL